MSAAIAPLEIPTGIVSRTAGKAAPRHALVPPVPQERPRLLPAAPPALLMVGPWRQPFQEALQPRQLFDVVPASTRTGPVKKRRNSRRQPRRSAIQLDWTAAPYTLAEWLRLPPIRDTSARASDAPAADRVPAKWRSLPRRTGLTAAERLEQARIIADRTPVRPKIRGECAGVPRPCSFVSCRHHLYLSVSLESGRITLNFPDIEPGEMPPNESCSLDVADRPEIDFDTPLDIIPLSRLLNRTAQRTHGLVEDAIAEAESKSVAFRVLDGVDAPEYDPQKYYMGAPWGDD